MNASTCVFLCPPATDVREIPFPLKLFCRSPKKPGSMPERAAEEYEKPADWQNNREPDHCNAGNQLLFRLFGIQARIGRGRRNAGRRSTAALGAKRFPGIVQESASGAADILPAGISQAKVNDAWNKPQKADQKCPKQGIRVVFCFCVMVRRKSK